MPTLTRRSSTALGLWLAISPAALAGLSQSAITAPGGFAQTAAFPTSSGSFLPGQDLSTRQVGTLGDFDELAFAFPGSSSVASAYNEPNYALLAFADAGMGYFRARGVRNSPSGASFSLWAANGGWKETFTITHPGLAGQGGVMTFQLGVAGQLEVSGFNGSAAVTVNGYKNNVELTTSPYFNPGSSDPGAGLQRVVWGLASFGQPDSRTVDGQVTMAVTFTFGQPFTLGVYAFIRGGHRSQGGGGNSFGEADFTEQGVTWSGITGMLDSTGAPISGFTLTGASGINWFEPQGQPCKPDLTTTALPGTPGYGQPNGTLNNDDFFFYLAAFASGNLSIADLTTTAIPGSPGFGIPNGQITNDDFFYYLTLFAAGC